VKIENVTLRIDDVRDSEAFEALIARSTEEVRKAVPALGHAYDPMLRERIWQALREEVDFDLFDWIAGAWTILDEVRALRDKPGPQVLPLASCPVKGALHPVISVIVDRLEVSIPITIEVTATFGALLLNATQGFITALEAGECDLSAEIQWHDHALGEPRKLKSYKAPFSHKFAKPGLRIP
jgi:hypothetical protein